MSTTNDILSLADIPREYGVSERTVRRYWKKWPHFKIGKRPRFRRSELDRHFSNAGRVEASQPQARRVIIPKRYGRSA